MNILIPSTYIKTVHTKVTQFPALAPSLSSHALSSLLTVNNYPSYYTSYRQLTPHLFTLQYATSFQTELLCLLSNEVSPAS